MDNNDRKNEFGQPEPQPGETNPYGAGSNATPGDAPAGNSQPQDSQSGLPQYPGATGSEGGYGSGDASDAAAGAGYGANGQQSYGAAGYGSAGYGAADPTGYGAAGNGPANAGEGSVDSSVVRPWDGDAVGTISAAWRSMNGNWGAWIGGVIVQFVIGLILAFVLLFTTFSGVMDENYVAGELDFGTAELAVVVVVSLLLTLWLNGNVYAAANRQAAGEKIGVLDFVKFDARNFMVGLSYVVSSVIIFVGLILFIIPGLLAIFFLVWTPAVMAADPSVGLWEAMKRSAQVARRQSSNTVVLIILTALISWVGSFFVITMLISVPVVYSVYALFVRTGMGLPVSAKAFAPAQPGVGPGGYGPGYQPGA